MRKLIRWVILFVSNIFRAAGMRSCRFYPSCSRYSIEAFEKFGFFKAFRLMAKRVLSCHPFSCGGYQPLIQKAE